MIAEPTSDLWHEVKAIYNAWPPDNEEVAAALSGHLSDFGSAATTGHGDLRQTGRALAAAWPDAAGAIAVGKVGPVADDWSKIAQTSGYLAGAARQYASALTSVKNIITGTIAASEPMYELFKTTSLLAPLRHKLVSGLAANFRRLVGEDVPPTAGKPQQQQHNSWLHPSFGMVLGGSISLGPINFGITAGVIQDKSGHLALIWGPQGTANSQWSYGGFLGGGFLFSDGARVQDQAGPFNQVGGSVGDEAAADGSYAWGHSDDGAVHDVTVMGGLGEGYGIKTPKIVGNGGNSTTTVVPIPLPWAR